MLKTYKYDSSQFFFMTFVLSWLSWGFAIYASWQPSLQYLLLPFVLAGISGPTIATLLMLIKTKNKELWNDFFQRLRVDSIKRKFIPISLLLFPCLIVLAITISLFFGQSVDQFSIISQQPDQALAGISLLQLYLLYFWLAHLKN